MKLQTNFNEDFFWKSAVCD